MVCNYIFIDFTGVISVAVEGVDKDQLVVIGEGVDLVNLTYSLRKKLCYATLLGVQVIGHSRQLKEVPCGIHNLRNLKEQRFIDMLKEFDESLDPELGLHY